jgi:hypothetical protein
MSELNVTPLATTEAQPVDTSSQRPAGLPEKFNSVEDLVKSYSELETKMGSSGAKAPPQEQPKAEPTDSPLEDLVTKAQASFSSEGKISEDILKEFQKAGIPSNYVQELVEGRAGKQDAYTKSLYEVVGGQEGWKELSSWASQSLSAPEREAFNSAINSGNPEQAKFALEGIKARHKAATSGPRGDLQIPSGQPGSSAGFVSKADYKKALSDPRYANDESYRSSILLRLKATPDSVLV